MAEERRRQELELVRELETREEDREEELEKREEELEKREVELEKREEQFESMQVRFEVNRHEANLNRDRFVALHIRTMKKWDMEDTIRELEQELNLARQRAKDEFSNRILTQKIVENLKDHLRHAQNELEERKLQVLELERELEQRMTRTELLEVLVAINDENV